MAPWCGDDARRFQEAPRAPGRGDGRRGGGARRRVGREELDVNARTDEELLLAWRAGDEAAGNELFDRHFDAVFRFLRHKAEAAVEDLVRQTFLACLSSPDAIPAGVGLRAGLLAVARRQLYGHLHSVRGRETPIDFTRASLQSLGAIPDRGARQRDDALARAAMARLPLEQQIALELYYFEEMPASEVAAVLGATEDAVRDHVTRALGEVRAQIAALGPTQAIAELTLRRLDAITAGRAP